MIMRSFCFRMGSLLMGAILVAGGPWTIGQSLDPPTGEFFQQDVAWSPDGKWIAFSELAGGSNYSPDNWSVYVARADGTDRHLVAKGAMWVGWSPDGSKLVFSTTGKDGRTICTARRDGSEWSCFPPAEGKNGGPAWSPRGDRLAFHSSRMGNEDIFLADPDGSNIKRLTDNESRDFNPQWSSDGKQIVFYREKGDKKDQIVVINADGTDERTMTEGKYHNVFPAFDSGGHIVFHRTWSKDDRGFVRCDPKTGEIERLDGVSGFFARWSPDGKRIALIDGRWPRSAVHVLNVEDKAVRKVIN